MKEPNNAPVYAAALYTDLAKIARRNGYALAVHGSLARDMDLICVPWTKRPSSPQVIIEAITTQFAITAVGDLTEKPHGRLVQTLALAFGECFIDLSFMPRVPVD